MVKDSKVPSSKTLLATMKKKEKKRSRSVNANERKRYSSDKSKVPAAQPKPRLIKTSNGFKYMDVYIQILKPETKADDDDEDENGEKAYTKYKCELCSSTRKRLKDVKWHIKLAHPNGQLISKYIKLNLIIIYFWQ